MVSTSSCPRYINYTAQCDITRLIHAGGHLDESVSCVGRVPVFTQSTIVGTMASYVELPDESARQMSKVSVLPATDSSIVPKVLLESSLETRGLHNTGNLVIADGFRTLFRRLLAALSVSTRLFSYLLARLHLFIS